MPSYAGIAARLNQWSITTTTEDGFANRDITYFLRTEALGDADGEAVKLENRHCEEPTGPAFGRPDDKLRDEAIQSFLWLWIASRSLSSGAHSRDPFARNDEAWFCYFILS
jgi:hypothetical protein